MMYYAATRNFQRAYGSLKTKFKIKLKSVELYSHSPYMHYILNLICFNVDICEKSAKDRFWTPYNLLKCYRRILVLEYGRVPNLLQYGEKTCLWFTQNEWSSQMQYVELRYSDPKIANDNSEKSEWDIFGLCSWYTDLAVWEKKKLWSQSRIYDF